MSFVNWFGVVTGLLSVALGFYAYFESKKQKQGLAWTGGVLAAVLLITAFISAIFPFPSQNTVSSGSNKPITQAGVTRTPQITITPSTEATPSPTDTPTPSPSPTVTPQPTAVKPGEIIYMANFSKNLSDWSYDPSQWFPANGALIGKGGGQATLNYPMPTANYKVIATVIISNTSVAGTNSYFGIVARYQSSSVGDAILFSDVTNSYIGVSTCPNNSCAGQGDRLYSGIPTNQTIQMQITCVDANITVSAVGHTIPYVDMQNPPAAGSVVIVNDGMSVELLSLRVIAA